MQTLELKRFSTSPAVNGWAVEKLPSLIQTSIHREAYLSMTTNITRRPSHLKFTGRILFLTEDTALIRQQLAGADLPFDASRPLMNNISTDEITPGWVCFYYDETLGRYVYAGMRDNPVSKDEVKNGGFSVVVSGLSKGCGSSRETAPFAEQAAGIQLVIARTIEKIYGQNCQNIGLLTSTNFGLIPRILNGETIALEEFTGGLDPIARQIVEHGGLLLTIKRVWPVKSHRPPSKPCRVR